MIVTNLKSSRCAWQPTASGNLQFWLKAIDRYGIYSIDSATVILAVIPPTITGLTSQVIDNNVLLYWTNTPGSFDIAKVEIRKGLDLAASTLIGELSGTFTAIFETSAGTYKYWVVPIDIAGLRGIGASLYATVNQPPDYVLHDQRPLEFTGVKTNCVVDQSIFYAPVNSTETYQAHFACRSWTTPQDQVDAGSPHFIQPATATARYVETIDYGEGSPVVIPSTRISVYLTKESVIGMVTITPKIEVSLNGTDWTASPGVYETYAVNFRYARITLDFATSDNGFVKITGSEVRLDVKLKTIQGAKEVLAADPGGTSVDITGEFIDVQSIILSPQGTTPAIAVYDFVDTGNPTSFKILLFNTAGTRMNGKVSYTIKGV